MKSAVSRRDFLKLAGLVPASLALPQLLRIYNPSQAPAAGGKNVMVIVFDAFSAYHLPIYGYPRRTTPNIERLAARAIVYHNHYAGGNFTTPGTASLLTGTLPWTHRAFQLNGTVTPSMAEKNIFKAFQRYHRVVYSHNPLVNTLFKQFSQNLDDYVPQDRLFLTADTLVHTALGHDEDIADVAWTRAFKNEADGFSYSLFLSNLYTQYVRNRIARFAQQFPRGLPSIRGDNYFLLEDAIDWLQGEVRRLPQPYFGYFHFMPPHAPTSTQKDFYGAFSKDGFEPPLKPQDVFSAKLLPPELLRQRTAYDEFVLYLDREFGRLFDYLETSGVLENTWVILTADHGELFERGVRGHISPLLYQPVVRIPLLVFEPGRTTRLDITSLTSAVDVLPTLLHVTGEQAVNWVEGAILPPFAPAEPDPHRVVYSLHAKRNKPREALTVATAMMAVDRLKLMYFFGYEELGEGVERVELYDVLADPQELHNLSREQAQITAKLLAALKAKLAEVNAPYL
jgi:arylsulfatase A-like enzyme